MADLLDKVRDHLVAQSIVRRPRETTPAGKPPLWLHPRDGVPAPGEGNNATERGTDTVIGLFWVDEIATKPGEGFLRRDIVEFKMRVTKDTLAQPLAEALVEQFAGEAWGYKIDWMMGTTEPIRVLESSLRNGLAPIGADPQSFDFRISFVFDTYRT